MRNRPWPLLMLPLMLVDCTPSAQPPTKISTPAAQEPALDATPLPATPKQTLADLRKEPITALDLGLYRIHEKMLPELEQRLRAAKLLPQITPAMDVMERGFVLFKLTGTDDYLLPLELSVSMGQTNAAATEESVRELQDRESRVVTFVRSYLGGPCPESTNPDRQDAGVCQSATGFQYWFDRPSKNGTGPAGYPAETRAAYNLYSLVSIQAWATLKGKHAMVSVDCIGPAIRVEVKCQSSGE